MKGRSSSLLLAAMLLVIQLACWRGTVRLRPRQPATLLKRSLDQGQPSNTTTNINSTPWITATTSSDPTTPSCQPLPTTDSPEDLCNHIRLYCPRSGHLDYLQFYYCIGVDKVASTPDILISEKILEYLEADGKHPAPLAAKLTVLRIVALICIILWMLFLFSWVGVVASDFFCPNLGTIAARLGLSESTAGVTFLAFGNGSPDVFSTFGAMRTGSGSLAVGELIGAASYIVSVISGSMMLIAPFRVKPYPFLRDVGFFTVAVATMMVFLFDGKLHFNECAGMIVLYFTYATTVIVGSWWQARRRRQRLLMSTIRDEYSNTPLTGGTAVTGTDMERIPSNHLTIPPSPINEQVSPYEYDPDVDPFGLWNQRQQQQQQQQQHPAPNQRGTPEHSPLLTGYDMPTSSSTMSNAALQRFKSVTGARHSLLGAVEFRDVVRSLQQEALADRSIEIYQSRDPERFLPHHHHHPHASLEVPPQRVQRSVSQKGHTRGRSLMTFHDVVPSGVRSNSIGETKQGKPAILRSVTTDGPSPSSSGISTGQADESWSFTKSTQPSAFDATAVAAAVGDPWKEHSVGDGCEQIHFPSSSRGVDVDREIERPKPRIEIPTSSRSSGNRLQDSEGIEVQDRSGNPGRHTTDWVDIRSRLTPTLKVLFPSLGHIHEKSWLGVAVGIITAPAILILNLTLPVVDDEAENAALSGEKVTTLNDIGQYSKGAIRLEGAEGDINATTFNDEEENDNEDHIINLSSATQVPNPWHGSDSDAEEEQNRRKHLQLASTLRNLPRDASPLMGKSSKADSSKKDSSVKQLPGMADVQQDDDASDTDSCDSHVTQSSHLFLAIAQCIFAPPFCVWAVSSSADSSHILIKTGVALLAGLGLAFVVVVLVAQSHRLLPNETRTSLRIYLAIGWARVAAGFLVSILYIMTIVDEVVSILQTLGLILGLSDAILGLTVFAMGNSLGDLVANVTIARMGHPVMAISACFAGPLLNLLLGIGISGTWLLSGNRMDSIPNQPNSHSSSTTSHSGHVYHIDFSPTLTVSGLGLLVILIGTLIAVPLNGFYLNRSIGLSLIITYAVIMTTNVLVEIYYPDKR